jgi:hypothetical protein
MNQSTFFSTDDLKDSILTDESVCHLLRHFPYPGENFLIELSHRTGKGKKLLEDLISKPGSKFSEKFARQPLEVITKVRDQLKKTDLNFVWNTAKCEIILTFPECDFPSGVGFDNLLAKQNLTPAQSREIIYVERDGFTVGTVVAEPPVTWQVNLVLQQKFPNSIIEVLTLFPGTYAPPFPNAYETGTGNHQQSIDFWEKHVFIVPPEKNSGITPV